MAHPLTTPLLGVVPSGLLGCTRPRLLTPPLVVGDVGPCPCGECALTPETSYGFDFIGFCADVGNPLDPWQQLAAVHLGELLPDGRPRFRFVLLLVARQNGKTELVELLIMYWLYIGQVELVLGTSSKLDYARESWDEVRRRIMRRRFLRDELAPNGIRKANGEQTITILVPDPNADPDDADAPGRECRYKIAAATEDAGRSLTVHRLVLDELRKHNDFTCHDAAVPTTNAVPDAQILACSNQGDDTAVVLHELRGQALTFIETGVGDYRLGLLEWSSPDGSDPTDPYALAQANPNVGRYRDRNHWDDLMGPALRAKAAGGKQLAGFRIEYMCMRVPRLNPAVDEGHWRANTYQGAPLGVDPLRGRVVLCFDVSPDERHAVLYAAAMDDDGIVWGDVVAAWASPADLRADLPGHVRRIRPLAVGWFPGGPAAAVAAAMSERRRGQSARTAWPPPGVSFVEITGDVPAACMGLAELVAADQFKHGNDPLTNDHVIGAEKLQVGDRWRFVRGTQEQPAHCSGAYAVAGAAYLARTTPPRPRLQVAGGRRSRSSTENNG